MLDLGFPTDAIDSLSVALTGSQEPLCRCHYANQVTLWR